MKMSFEEVVESLKQERQNQDIKCGALDEKKQSVAGYMLVLKKELEEAEAGWMKNVQGKHSALSEIRQVAATAIACLQQHGVEGNPL